MAETLTDSQQRMRAAAKHRHRRRWLILGLIVVVIIGAAVLILPGMLTPIVQRKLEALVSNHLHARIEIGSLSYRFPYGVSVRDAKFVTDESHDGVQLVTVKSLELSLAKLPIGPGPIVIRSFTVVDPVVHIVRREDGSLVGSQLVKRTTESPRPQERMKLSDVLQLRKFDLSGATIVYDDRAHAEAKPMEWRNIGASMRLSPQSGSRYRFNFSAESKPVAQIELAGAVDVDSLIVDIENFAVSADVQRDAKSSPLPAQLQAVLQNLGVEGAVRLDATGQLPLKDPKAGRLAMNLVLDRVRAEPLNQPWAMEELSAKLHAERGTGDAANRVDVRLSDVLARGMGAIFELQNASGTIDLAAKTWMVEGISGAIAAGEAHSDPNRKSVLRYVQSGRIDFNGGARGSFAPDAKRVERADVDAKLDRLSIQLPNFPQPLEAINGQIRVNADRAVLQNITALYGNDRLNLNQAIVALSDLPIRIELQDILASADFGVPPVQYPAPLNVAMEQLNPTGKIDIQGTAALYRRDKRVEPDYALELIPQGTNVLLFKQRIPVTNVRGSILIAPRLISMKYVEGDMFDGRVALRGSMVSRMPVTYDGELRAQDADLSQFCVALGELKPDGSPKISGRAVGKFRFKGEFPKTGEGDPRDSIVGTGRVYVHEGNFWSAPLLDGVAKQLHFGNDLLTAGDAAAAFDVKDGKVELHRAAINSAALGVQGSGVVELRGPMDLSVVVAPLGDWRRKIRSTGVPLLSNVAGDIVGQIQKLVNSATSELLYEFRVTGKVGDPKITAVPAPILTDTAANVFGVMMRGTHADRLIETIAGKDTDELPQQAPSTAP